MRIIVNASIISSGREQPGLVVGVNAVRKLDPRGRVAEEGIVVQCLKDAKGTEVLIVMTPDEAREHGMMLVHTSYAAAGVVPPRIELRDAAAEPTNGVHLIGGKQ